MFQIKQDSQNDTLYRTSELNRVTTVNILKLNSRYMMSQPKTLT